MQIQLVPCALPQKLSSSSYFAMIWKTAIRESGNILYAIVRYLAGLKYITYILFHNDFTIISINGDYKI